MDIQAHIERDMAVLGCKNQTKIALAIRLYFYLVDAQKAYDVDYCYCADADELYCLARVGKGDRLRLYVPRPASWSTSMKELRRLQLQLCTVETGPGVNIAFIESDSTLVIYNFEAHLPSSTTPAVLSRRGRMLRRQLIDGELKKRTNDFISEALDGVDVDDDDVAMID